MTIQEKVDELLSRMTPAEKAGQLTQYFYFRLPEGAPGPVLDIDADEQPEMVESKLADGVVGSLLFVTDPARINRLQRLAVEGHRLGRRAQRWRPTARATPCCSASTSSTGCAPSCPCRSRWPPPGTPRRSRRARWW